MRAVAPERVTMLDQSPHQLARARRKPALAGVAKVIGDAEALPFATDSLRPLRLDGQHRVLARPPARDRRGLPRRCGPAAWRCSPGRCGARTRSRARCRTPGCSSRAEDEYVAWFERAGFETIERVHVAPDWWDPRWDRYAVAIAAVKPRAGEPPRAAGAGAGARRGAAAPALPVRLARFAAGSLAGAAFIPVALWFTLARKLRR